MGLNPEAILVKQAFSDPDTKYINPQQRETLEIRSLMGAIKTERPQYALQDISLPRYSQQVESLIATKADKFSPSDIIKEIKSSGASIDTDDAAAHLDLRNDRLAFGDMYEYIREAELTIHSVVKMALVANYGIEDWWRKGVPETIRGDLASERERDPVPAAEPYCYTSIVQLREIIKTQWNNIFKTVFPKELTVDKKSFLDSLLRLNQIRRLVMLKGVESHALSTF